MKMIKWPVFSFFAFAYIWSWAWWIPVVLELRSQGSSPWNILPVWIIPFVLIGAYGPTISAVLMTALSTGKPGLKSLLSRFLIWRAPSTVHLLIWLGPPIFLGIAMLFDLESFVMLGNPDWTRLQLIPMVLLGALPFGPLAEELGWRGFALPTLQKKHSALVSSIIIGVFWCFWHTPLFWAPAGTLISGYEVTILAVGKYLLFATGLAIIFTWIFNNSKGSVLLSVAFHLMINASLPYVIFPARNGDAANAISWLTIIPIWVVALVLIAFYGAKHLSKNPQLSSE